MLCRVASLGLCLQLRSARLYQQWETISFPPRQSTCPGGCEGRHARVWGWEEGTSRYRNRAIPKGKKYFEHLFCARLCTRCSDHIDRQDPPPFKGLLAQGEKEKVRCDGYMTEKARTDLSVKGEGSGAGQYSQPERRRASRAGPGSFRRMGVRSRGYKAGRRGWGCLPAPGPGGAALGTTWEEKSSQTALSTSTHQLLVKCPGLGLAGGGFPSLVNGMNSRQII